MSQQDMDLRSQIAMAIARDDWNHGLSANGTPGEHTMGEADAVLEVVLPLIEKHRQAVAVLAAERDESTAELMRAATAYRSERDAAEASRRDWAAEAVRLQAEVDHLREQLREETIWREDIMREMSGLDPNRPIAKTARRYRRERDEARDAIDLLRKAGGCGCLSEGNPDPTAPVLPCGHTAPRSRPSGAVHPEADR
jgi:hypothetical protein